MANDKVNEIYRIALGNGKFPDGWQTRFATDEWPEVLIAPTGSGKTAGVTLGWAAHRLRNPEKTPRRLVWCLPMRTLAQQTTEAVKEWFGNLQNSSLGGSLIPADTEIHLLMGGEESARWLDNAELPAVIIGTQDMLLSRALMRGYASSRAIWPMEFALLHEDTQWVFDEVQLMGAGLGTSAQLEAFRRCEAARVKDEPWAARCPARSLWISATLKPGWLKTVDFPAPSASAVRRIDPRKPEDFRLQRLVTAQKTLSRAHARPSSSRTEDIKKYVASLADMVIKAHRAGRMTLVIVNQVKRAQSLFEAIERKLQLTAGISPQLALIHGRFRSADRQREMNKVVRQDADAGPGGRIVVATQAVEAGVDISAAVLFTELAPWPAMVQRFGRANRYAELHDGADVRWIDLLAESDDDKSAQSLSHPYLADELRKAREHLNSLTDVAPANLPGPGDIHSPMRVIRRKDLQELFDTDPDLTGFDVDISAYVRDADDTDLRVFWRDLSTVGDDPPRPNADELCTVSIGIGKDWLTRARKSGSVYVRDAQWRRAEKAALTVPAGWSRLTEDPWPGLTLLVDLNAGGYCGDIGFTGNPKHTPVPVLSNDHGESGGEADGHDEDPRSGIGVPVPLCAHLGHVASEADLLCQTLKADAHTRASVVRAARWHDLGKAHEVFQDSMRRGLGDCEIEDGVLLAKTIKRNIPHKRPYFRHELASALALLTHENWSRDADLAAYLVAAHHGKVRMNMRALPLERPPPGEDRSGDRFARGIWESDKLQDFDLGDGERWSGGLLTLSIMELGWDERTLESWTERTRDLLARYGPFRLAWMETLGRLADWRASRKEQKELYAE